VTFTSNVTHATLHEVRKNTTLESYCVLWKQSRVVDTMPKGEHIHGCINFPKM